MLDSARRQFRDQMRAILTAAVDIIKKTVSRYRDIARRSRGKALRQRVLQRRTAEGMMACACDANAHRVAEARKKNADNAESGGGIDKFYVGRLIWSREADGNDDLRWPQGRCEGSDDEIICGNVAEAGVNGCAKREDRRRITRARIVVSQRATDCASVAHQGIANTTRKLSQRRDNFLDHFRF